MHDVPDAALQRACAMVLGNEPSAEVLWHGYAFGTVGYHGGQYHVWARDRADGLFALMAPRDADDLDAAPLGYVLLLDNRARAVLDKHGRAPVVVEACLAPFYVAYRAFVCVCLYK